MRDVGNRHPQAPAAQALLTVQRIVEIAGILAVDGDKGLFTQVCAILLVFLARLRLQGTGLTQDLFRPLVGNIVGADRDIDFQARVQVVAEDLDDAALGAEIAGRVVGDLGGNDLAGFGAALELRRNQDAVVDPAVVGHHEANATLFFIAADDAAGTAVQDFNHPALRASAPVQANDGDQHLVAVEYELHLPRAQVKVIALLQRNGEAVAIAVALHPAANQVHLFNQAVGAATVDHQLAIALHRPQALAQSLDRVLVFEQQLLGDMRVSQGLVRRSEQFEDRFAAGNGVVVTRSFALGMGIGNLAFFGHIEGGFLVCFDYSEFCWPTVYARIDKAAREK